jgi:septal ring factor EnvC (AmiA/AmiB activator)
MAEAANNRKPSLQTIFAILKWTFGAVFVIGSVMTYFFLSQATQDAAHASSRERLRVVETVVEDHEKAFEKVEKHVGEQRKATDSLKDSVIRIEVRQMTLDEYLRDEMKDIKEGLKDLKESP